MHNPILQDPAEGSRDIIDRELRRMERQIRTAQIHTAKAGPDDVLKWLGELSPDLIAAILALEPSELDLELAALWGQGDGDLPAAYGHILTGKPAAIVDIIRPDLEVLEDER